MKTHFHDVSIFIATHSFGSVMTPYAQSLAMLCGHLGAWRISHSILILEDAFVDRGRDRAARAFLESGMTHMLFLDADVQFEPSDVVRLIQAQKPMVAGGYRYKNDSGNFAVSFHENAHAGVEWDDAAKAISVDGVGCGFMLIAREVFERIKADTPELAYRAKGGTGEMEAFHGFFNQGRDGDQIVGEDIAFCRRWRAAERSGFARILCLTHWGRVPFSGRLSDQVRVVDQGAA